VVAERRARWAAFAGAAAPQPLRGRRGDGDEKDVADSVVCGSDPGEFLEAIGTFAKAGFDHVYVHQVGPDQSGFVDFFAREVLADARALTPRGRVTASA
jgi:hypothetical protein